MPFPRLLLWCALPLAAGIAAHALGHHAFSAEFDKNAPVTLEGKVTRIEWINPHAWIHLAVVDDAGKTVAWMVEGGTPNTLLRAGINNLADTTPPFSNQSYYFLSTYDPTYTDPRGRSFYASLKYSF